MHSLLTIAGALLCKGCPELVISHTLRAPQHGTAVAIRLGTDPCMLVQTWPLSGAFAECVIH